MPTPTAPLLCAAAASLTLATGPASAAATKDSVFIPFANMPAGQTELTGSPTLHVGFNGGHQGEFLMDTGSTGIAASPDIFTPASGEASSGTGTITYTSSGRILTGNFYMTEVQIGSGAASATAKVPVLQVTNLACVQHPRNCTPASPPTGLAMFGVGFGQEAGGQPYGTPAKNPFLNIVEMAGHRVSNPYSYMLTAQGVTLGVTPQIAHHFRQVKLSWNSTYHDWNRAPLTLQMLGSAGWTGTGTVLMDTGVGSMYMTPPLGDAVPTIPAASATGNCIQYAPCAAPGTRFTISIGQSGQSGASYTFRIGPNGIPGTKQKAAPDWVTVDSPTTSVAFVNTTYHFLNRFDYMYDYTYGLVGFRPVPSTVK